MLTSCCVVSMIGVLSEIVGAVCGMSLQACFGIINDSVVGLFFGLL